MSSFLRGACALLIGAVMGAGSLAENAGGQVESGVKTLFEGVTSEAGAVEPASCDCDTYGDVTCDLGCDPGCCGSGGCGVGGCPGQVFVGAEWLNVRAEFSEATAYRELDNLNSTETFEQFDMNYGSSYRVYGGYRLCECGCDITFTYTNFDSDGSFASGEAPGTGTLTTITSPFEVEAAPGDELFGEASVQIDNYDIGFSKTIPLGCRLQCGGCGDCADCCDPCGCGPICPAWDIVWMGGIRFANVDSSLSYFNERAPANIGSGERNATSRVDFDGAGLRFGMLGRRYFGRRGLVSAYVRGDISLLLGEVNYTVTGNFVNDTTLTSTEVIPVTEIEAGITGYLTSNLSVSAGYLLSAWHDLGHRAEYDYGVTGTQILSMDDANMMTLDGLFIRAEAAF